MFGLKKLGGDKPLHEFWREYTAREIAKVKQKKCKHCPYRGVFNAGDGTSICCDYLIITGQSRGCRPEFCQHYKDFDVEKKNAFKSYSPLKKEQIYG